MQEKKVGRPKIDDPYVPLGVRVRKSKKEDVKKVVYLIRDSVDIFKCPWCGKPLVFDEVGE